MKYFKENGTFTGELLGGCVDVFPMMVGTKIWPKKEEWKNKILFLETSEDEIKPLYLQYILRNLVAQGIFEEISRNNSTQNLKMRHIMKSINFGHTSPMAILPLGLKVEVDLDKKEIRFLEKPMED